ncbi:hypothetical protein [Mycobacterium mantenii]|uniref:Uncharacterized protein n=1 Tax=Mycobacterium mantenii TaxID=560555 RepID=A0A1A2SSB4_MYCNT|nr:hypothetical protein [Mycobacterium mantenii]OBH49506.1 hypothetical protein A5688_02855 [Mycobacterium mantenii]OBH67054.1 hypothetical protein A5683_09930 [Mycobacterium mantenii]
MATDHELEASLIDALRYSSGDPASDRVLRESIRAGIVRDDADLLNIYEREVGPEQAEVDLHLVGPGIERNAANARQFSLFVSGISDAVKETAKARVGRRRYRDNLLVEGATPGSVRVVLRVAAPEVPAEQTVDEETVASSVDSDALRTVASILAHASDPDFDTPLAAEIAELPIKARTALKRVANASQHGGWAVRGMIRQRRVGAADLELTNEGATRLRIELEVAQEKRVRETRTGTIDGFRWSLGTLYFNPVDAPAFAAGVMESRIAQEVTRLMNDPELRVAADFDVVESYLPGDQTRSRVSRVLTGIRPLGEQAALPVVGPSAGLPGPPKELPPGRG